MVSWEVSGWGAAQVAAIVRIIIKRTILVEKTEDRKEWYFSIKNRRSSASDVSVSLNL